VSSIKALEMELRRLEEQYRQRISEEEQKRMRAIEFLKQHVFILGSSDGETSETEAILKHSSRIRQLQQMYECDFHAFVWDAKVIAIPVGLKASFSVNVKELLPHARWFGESLAFFEDGDA